MTSEDFYDLILLSVFASPFIFLTVSILLNKRSRFS